MFGYLTATFCYALNHSAIWDKLKNGSKKLTRNSLNHILLYLQLLRIVEYQIAVNRIYN
jgi:hypothetical protein